MEKVYVELANMYNTKQCLWKIKIGQKVTKADPMADNLTSAVRLDCLLTDKYHR